MGLAAAPQFVERATLLRGIEIAYIVALAQLWNLLAGYAGLMSIGQQLYVGVGGYTLFASAIHFGVPALWALPIAALAGTVVALPSALLLFRLRGAQFAIGSWVLSEVVMQCVTRSDSLGGASGLSLPASVARAIASTSDERVQRVWWIALALSVGVTMLVVFWLRSRQGLALMALRDNPSAAAALGVNIRRVKLSVYLVVAAATATLGALIFLNKLRMSPAAAFSLEDWTAGVVFIVVLGGIGTIEGPLVGAVIYFALRGLLADYGAWYQLVMGLIAIVIMVWAPQGLWGLAERRWGWAIWPTRRVLRANAVADSSEGFMNFATRNPLR